MRDKVHESALENGLKVLTIENHASPTASVQVWYRVGSRHERPGITGISHILEHMMFKGTHRYPPGVFDRIVQEHGMTENAFTGHDFTAYHEQMAADRIEVALELEADRMQGLLLDPEELASELSVIREERRETHEDPPFGLLAEEVEAALFLTHPYRWPVIGWMSDLERITRDDVEAFYRTHYRPNNAILVVAGDATHARVMEGAARAFGSVPPGPAPETLAFDEPAQRGERTVRVHKDVQLPGLILAYRVMDSTHADAPALNVIEYLLLHGRSSRLYQRLVYRESLVTGLGGGFYVRRDPSTFTIRAAIQPGIETECVREAILETIDSLASAPPGDQELRKARNQIEADLAFGEEHNFNLAQNLGAEECRSSWTDFARFHQRCMEVDREAVARVTTAYLHDRARTTGYLIPDGKARP